MQAKTMIELLKRLLPKIKLIGDYRNIDINIKCSNSLVSLLSIDADMKDNTEKNQNIEYIKTYKVALVFLQCQTKKKKRELNR
ncbi:MAG: hypothetical protein IPK46_09020 [Saprospiraceae bacterium]|nr:hypothetical protein [Saprospiraceae bacterium]